MRINALLLALILLLSACGTLTEEGDLLFRTADPRLNIGIRLQQPPPLPDVEPSLMPTVTPTVDACVIKGNINAQGEKIAHSPGQANYNNTIIDEGKGERCFQTLEEAIAAGWRAARN